MICLNFRKYQNDSTIRRCIFFFKTLSQTINFSLIQIQSVGRRQFENWRKCQKVLQTGRKHGGKRRNCSLGAISPFPTVFLKGLYSRHVKTRACLEKCEHNTQRNFRFVQYFQTKKKHLKCDSREYQRFFSLLPHLFFLKVRQKGKNRWYSLESHFSFFFKKLLLIVRVDKTWDCTVKC